jgi:hypothetical protein
MLLKDTEHAEEVAGARIARGAEHVTEHFWRHARLDGEFVEADRGLDIVEEDAFRGRHVVGEEHLDRFGEDGVAEGVIAADAGFHALADAVKRRRGLGGGDGLGHGGGHGAFGRGHGHVDRYGYDCAVITTRKSNFFDGTRDATAAAAAVWRFGNGLVGLT